MSDPEHDLILNQAIEHARRMEISAETDGKKVEGEVAVVAGGESWALKVWGKITAKRGEKPNPGAGVKFEKRWLLGRGEEERDAIDWYILLHYTWLAVRVIAVLFFLSWVLSASLK